MLEMQPWNIVYTIRTVFYRDLQKKIGSVVYPYEKERQPSAAATPHMSFPVT
jgi:hypothetical protein